MSFQCFLKQKCFNLFQSQDFVVDFLEPPFIFVRLNLPNPFFEQYVIFYSINFLLILLYPTHSPPHLNTTIFCFNHAFIFSNLFISWWFSCICFCKSQACIFYPVFDFNLMGTYSWCCLGTCYFRRTFFWIFFIKNIFHQITLDTFHAVF